MIEVGEKEIVRMMFDKKARRLIVEFEQPVTEDGIEKQRIPSVLHARKEEFEPAMARLFPSGVASIEAEAKTIDNEKWQAEKAVKLAGKEK